MLYMWSFLYKGATIWFWGGGGGLANFVGTEYSFQHEVGWKIYFQVYQDQNIYFRPQRNFEKAPPPPKKKNHDSNKGGGVGM